MIFQAAGLDQRLKLDEHSQEGNGKGSDGEQMSEDSDDEGEGKDKDKNEDEQKENEDEQKENKVRNVQWRAKFSINTIFCKIFT